METTRLRRGIPAAPDPAFADELAKRVTDCSFSAGRAFTAAKRCISEGRLFSPTASPRFRPGEPRRRAYSRALCRGGPESTMQHSESNR